MHEVRVEPSIDEELVRGSDVHIQSIGMVPQAEAQSPRSNGSLIEQCPGLSTVEPFSQVI